MRNASTHNPVFADTGGWIALANPRDHLHSNASHLHKAWRAQHRPLITTGFVIAEVIAGLLSVLPHAAILRFVDTLRVSRNVRILHVTEVWEEGGYELFRRRPDKVWSLTDCISFVVMAELDLIDAFTYDHHFEQAGFRALLR